jgi:hypothetical protein
MVMKSGDVEKGAEAEIRRRTRIGSCKNCGYQMSATPEGPSCLTCASDMATPRPASGVVPDRAYSPKRRPGSHQTNPAAEEKYDSAISSGHNVFRSKETGLKVTESHPDAVGGHEGQYYKRCKHCNDG